MNLIRSIDGIFGIPPAVAPVAPKPAAVVPSSSFPPAWVSRLPAAVKAVAPNLSPSDAETWANVLAPTLRGYGITSALEVAAFLGQVSVESMGFRVTQENLNYSAPALYADFRTQFPTMDIANEYARQPQRIANRAYANRLGNGSEASGDGWAHRGRGLIQVTGKTAYERIAAALNITMADLIPWLSTVSGAAASACLFWTDPEHRPTLDELADAWNIAAITRAVNGPAMLGAADRETLSEKARFVLI